VQQSISRRKLKRRKSKRRPTSPLLYVCRLV